MKNVVLVIWQIFKEAAAEYFYPVIWLYRRVSG